MTIVDDCHLSLDYLKKYAVGDVFVETGTYKGAGVLRALQHGFKRIHTIELNEELYLKAVDLFAGNPEVKVWFGDSVDIIPQIVEELSEHEQQATFWLDAHASGPLVGGQYGPCPLALELRSIYGQEILTLNNTEMTRLLKPYTTNTHTLFIDDRRLLGSAEWGYISEETVTNLVLQINPEYKIHLLDGHVANDVMCATVRA